MKRSPGLVVLLAISSCLRSDAAAQIVDPVAYRGTIDALVHGRLDTTLVDLRFTNRGELAVHDLDKTGTWRRGIGGPHIDGMALIVGASVTGERAK
jgi:hypothetical protein